MGGLIQMFRGRGRDGLLILPWNYHGDSGCVISLLTEGQVLVKVDLSAILDPFDSN